MPNIVHSLKKKIVFSKGGWSVYGYKIMVDQNAVKTYEFNNIDFSENMRNSNILFSKRRKFIFYRTCPEGYIYAYVLVSIFRHICNICFF